MMRKTFVNDQSHPTMARLSESGVRQYGEMFTDSLIPLRSPDLRLLGFWDKTFGPILDADWRAFTSDQKIRVATRLAEQMRLPADELKGYLNEIGVLPLHHSWVDEIIVRRKKKHQSA